MLPLALLGALVLLLSSLSLQWAVLHSRQGLALERAAAEDHDRLAAAAHQLAAALSAEAGCLRPLPSTAWLAGGLPPGCAEGVDPQSLQRFEVFGAPVELVRWQPTAVGGELTLRRPGGVLRRYLWRWQPSAGVRELQA